MAEEKRGRPSTKEQMDRIEAKIDDVVARMKLIIRSLNKRG